MASDFLGRPRLEDVAQEAGVSSSTASRVLNGSARKVAEKYRLRVLEAAERIGYTTNLAAQATARGHYPAVGLVVGDIRDQFFNRIAYGAIHESSRHGLVVNILSTEGDLDRERQLIKDLRRQRPQSLILVRKRDYMPSADSTLMQELKSFEREGGRVVVVGESTSPLTAIRPPDFDGAKKLADALVGLGYRRFAALTRSDGRESARDRIDGFRAGLSAAGIALPDRLVFYGDMSLAGGVAAGRKYLDHGEPVDLIFAVEDVLAAGAILQLERHGLRIPEDLAVAGYGGRAMDHIDEHGRELTTVRSPLEEMGAAAVRLSLEAWPSSVVGLDVEILIRATTPDRSSVSAAG